MIATTRGGDLLQVRMGALAPPLRKQLVGLGIDRSLIGGFQADADAVTRLAVAGLLTERERDRVRERLVKRIVREVR